MNDLFQSTVGRDEFQQWLGLGTAPFTVWQGEKAVITLSRLEKNPTVDYLYRIGVEQDNSISWNSSMLFCGAYDSDYKLSELPEAAFIAYIIDPELFVQTEAEQHIKNNQERFLLQFLKNDALLVEYQALMLDAGNPIHRMKAITDAVKGCGAKTVTVTVQKDGQELTFKTAADSLTGHRSYYSTSDIPASDRREFERLFGRYADYNAGDVTRITYGRNTIYEAPAAPVEEMGPVMQMGGM